MKPTSATKEATGHSPLPWQLVEEPSDYADESAGSHYSIWAANDMTVALTVGDCIPHEQGNAQLIITAVNQRERLRDVLQSIIDEIDDAVDRKIRNGRLPPIGALLSTIQDSARAALNEVKE